MTNKIFTCNDLTVVYDDKKIIDKISFSLTENSLNAVLCPNNCGKTTLIKALSGIIYSDDGQICVNDIDLEKRYFKKYIASISTILEDIDNQFICNKVLEEIKYPLVNLCFKEKAINTRVEYVSSIFKIETILGKDIDRLSNIEKVKVLLASSVIHNPKLLLIDDIFKYLNDKESVEILKLLNVIVTKMKITILFTTSNILNVVDLDHIIVMSNGKKVLDDSYKNIVAKDNELSKMGFEIPIMIDLSRKLQFYNLIDNNIIYDVDEVIDTLWK